MYAVVPQDMIDYIMVVIRDAKGYILGYEPQPRKVTFPNTADNVDVGL
jgi:hypothetical protein